MPSAEDRVRAAFPTDARFGDTAAAVLKTLGCLRILPLGANCQLTHQHIPDGSDGEKCSPSRSALGSFLWKCCAYQVFLLLQTKDQTGQTKAHSPGCAFNWETGLSSKSLWRGRVSPQPQERVMTQFLCIFMHFMGTQKEIFTDESIQNTNRMPSFCDSDASWEQASHTFPPNLECVWDPCALRAIWGAGPSLGGILRAEPPDPDKTSLEGPGYESQQEMSPMWFCTDNRQQEEMTPSVLCSKALSVPPWA